MAQDIVAADKIKSKDTPPVALGGVAPADQPKPLMTNASDATRDMVDSLANAAKESKKLATDLAKKMGFLRVKCAKYGNINFIAPMSIVSVQPTTGVLITTDGSRWLLAPA